jgi:hypothetical protein
MMVAVFYTTWNFNKIPKMYFNSWLYVPKKNRKKQDIKVQQDLEMQCLEWLCSLLLDFLQQNGLKINNRKL